MYFEILISGFGGGLLRGLVGFIKHQYSYKKVGFDIYYFFVMSFLAGIIGVLTAVSVKELDIGLFGEIFTPAMAFIVGYAGGDFIENLYKIIFKKISFFTREKE